MKKKWIKRVIFIIGFLLCFLPLVNNTIQQRHQSDAVATYQKIIEHQEESQIEELFNAAQEYNSLLYQSQGAIIDQVDFYSDEHYNQQLDVSGTGIMGSLDIPNINVNLPIYHGTGEEALANGIGHIQGTSLPVGGTNSHAVLSGHRGLPSSKLLVRLDEMKEGDYFFIRTCNKTLAYKVTEIQTVEPDDVSCLEIEPEKDLLSLVTCTPYGLNTHRLIVTGTRVEYAESVYESIEESIPSARELIFTILPFVFLFLAITLYLIDRRRLSHEIKAN